MVRSGHQSVSHGGIVRGEEEGGGGRRLQQLLPAHLRNYLDLVWPRAVRRVLEVVLVLDGESSDSSVAIAAMGKLEDIFHDHFVILRYQGSRQELSGKTQLLNNQRTQSGGLYLRLKEECILSNRLRYYLTIMNVFIRAFFPTIAKKKKEGCGAEEKQK